MHQQQKIENGEILVPSCDGVSRVVISEIRCHIPELASGCILSVLHVEQSLHKHRCSATVGLERRLLKYEGGYTSQSEVSSTTLMPPAVFDEA